MQVCDDFARKYASSSFVLAVRVQGVIVLISRGELFRQRSELAGGAARLTSESQGYLRTSVRLLEALSQDIVDQLRTGSRLRPKQASDLSRDQLLALQKNARFQLARAFRNQGQTYPPESPDRDNALRRAIEILSQLGRLSAVDPLVWRSRLEEIVCFRLMKNYAAADAKIRELLADEPPPKIVLQTRAQQARVLLAQGKMQDAVALLGQGREVQGVIDADFDLAHLETWLAAWRESLDANQKEDAAQWQEKAVATVKDIERLHSPYWARRAEALLAKNVTGAGVPGDLALRIRSAQGLYRQGQIDEAVNAYDGAAALAEQQGRLEQAFDWRFTAASIEHQRKHFPEAKRRFRELALSQTKHPRAGDAHLMAIYDAAQQARQSSPVKLDEYASLIREHLENWPHAASANQARWYLGRLRQFERKWPEAVAALAGIEVGDEHHAEAVAAMEDCYQNWLAGLADEGQPTAERAQEAAIYFERLLLGSETPPRWPEQWSPADRSAALAASKIRLEYLPDPYARVEQVLSAALAGLPQPPAEWRDKALGPLAVACAGQGKFSAARQALEGAPNANVDDLFWTLTNLSRLAGASTGEAKQELGHLRMAVAQHISSQRARLTPAQQRRFDLLQASAAADSGHQAAALDLLRRLAKENPRDAEAQETLARRLAAADDRATLQEALAKWRELERHSKPDSPRWFRAKYHVADLHFRLGDPQRAAKIIQVTQVLHPDLGGQELKQKFSQLLQRCQQP